MNEAENIADKNVIEIHSTRVGKHSVNVFENVILLP